MTINDATPAMAATDPRTVGTCTNCGATNELLATTIYEGRMCRTCAGPEHDAWDHAEVFARRLDRHAGDLDLAVAEVAYEADLLDTLGVHDLMVDEIAHDANLTKPAVLEVLGAFARLQTRTEWVTGAAALPDTPQETTT